MFSWHHLHYHGRHGGRLVLRASASTGASIGSWIKMRLVQLNHANSGEDV